MYRLYRCMYRCIDVSLQMYRCKVYVKKRCVCGLIVWWTETLYIHHTCFQEFQCMCRLYRCMDVQMYRCIDLQMYSVREKKMRTLRINCVVDGNSIHVFRNFQSQWLTYRCIEDVQCTWKKDILRRIINCVVDETIYAYIFPGIFRANVRRT